MTETTLILSILLKPEPTVRQHLRAEISLWSCYTPREMMKNVLLSTLLKVHNVMMKNSTTIMYYYWSSTERKQYYYELFTNKVMDHKLFDIVQLCYIYDDG